MVTLSKKSQKNNQYISVKVKNYVWLRYICCDRRSLLNSVHSLLETRFSCLPDTDGNNSWCLWLWAYFIGFLWFSTKWQRTLCLSVFTATTNIPKSVCLYTYMFPWVLVYIHPIKRLNAGLFGNAGQIQFDQRFFWVPVVVYCNTALQRWLMLCLCSRPCVLSLSDGGHWRHVRGPTGRDGSALSGELLNSFQFQMSNILCWVPDELSLWHPGWKSPSGLLKKEQVTGPQCLLLLIRHYLITHDKSLFWNWALDRKMSDVMSSHLDLGSRRPLDVPLSTHKLLTTRKNITVMQPWPQVQSLPSISNVPV